MKSKKIYLRLISAFTLVIVLMGIVGGFGIMGVSRIAIRANNMYEQNIEPLGIIAKVNDNFLLARFFYTRSALYASIGDKDSLDASAESLNEHIKALEQSIGEYGNVHMEDEELTYFDSIQSALSVFIDKSGLLIAECYNVLNGGDNSDMLKYLDDIKTLADVMNENINVLSVLNVGYGEEARDMTTLSTRVSLISIISVLLLFGTASITFEVRITRGIEKTIGSVIKKLIPAAVRINDVSNQLSEASDSLASGSSKQTAAIEETSATMNELASMIKKTAVNTRQAAHFAQASTETADNGVNRMTKMVKTMEEIKMSSDSMSQTIKDIDSISFQTNLLAINATVEAARAGGEAGRSFSVVAQEVRNLSQSSAVAAENTTSAIEKNLLLTNQGREASRTVAEALSRISSDAGELSRLILEISAASEQEASGIEQISAAMHQMERVTQQNAAVAEENAASSNVMKDESENLREAMEMAKDLVRERFYT